MGAIIRYFRTHPWHRRLLSSALAVVAALVLAIVLYPYASGVLIVRRLASPRPDVRLRAVQRAADRARRSDWFRGLLNGALDTPDDVAFAAAAEALDRADSFFIPARDALAIDRFNACRMVLPGGRLTPLQHKLARRRIVTDAIFAARDNEYVRRILSSALGEADWRMREQAAVLAAVIGDDAALRRCLADAEGRVVSSAAIAAGVAGRGGVYEAVAALLDAEDVEAASSAAYAAAVLRGEECSARLAGMLAGSRDETLRERLLHVMTVIGDERSRRAVADMLAAAREAGRYPPPMAVVAAARAGLAEADGRLLLADVKDLLTQGREGQWRGPHVLAAIAAANALHADVLDELTRLWMNPSFQPPTTTRPGRWHEFPLVWIHAARLMGRLASSRDADDASVKRAVEVLRLLADYHDPRVDWRPYLTMPAASGAAAAALWRLDGGEWQPLRRAAGAGDKLACDLIAWEVGHVVGGERAMSLGFRLLPARDAPPQAKEFNDDVRGTGALILGFAASTAAEKSRAERRILERLAGGRTGGEDNPRVVNMYRCALVAMGRRGGIAHVRRLFRSIPRRRALAALLLAGDRWALDYLLWGGVLRVEEIDDILVSQLGSEILAAAAPSLPPVDAAATRATRFWQIRILRCHYAVRRSRIAVGEGE
jgi:hypothetical protein